MKHIDELTLNLEMILTAVYDANGNDSLFKYIVCKTEEFDEEKGKNEEEIDARDIWIFEWKIPNLDSKVLQSPFYTYPDDKIEFKIEFDLAAYTIHAILKEMPDHLKQFSMKFDIEIQDINNNISGYAHFKRNKLKAKIIDVALDLKDVKKMTVTINTCVIAMY